MSTCVKLICSVDDTSACQSVVTERVCYRRCKDELKKREEKEEKLHA
jgi:hypothetical protein